MKLKVPPFTIRDDGLYQLGSDYPGITSLRGYDVNTSFCSLFPGGQLLIKSGFVWNGISGPTITTPATLMPTALHDCLYELIQLGYLPKEAYPPSDYTYRDALKTWRVPTWRRRLHLRGLRAFGAAFRKLFPSKPRNGA